jgi:hypothetical protein
LENEREPIRLLAARRRETRAATRIRVKDSVSGSVPFEPGRVVTVSGYSDSDCKVGRERAFGHRQSTYLWT